MPDIQTEVLNEFFGKTRYTEYATALKEAGEDQDAINAVHKQFLQAKLDEVKSLGKDEGKGWGKREALKELEDSYKDKYDVEGSNLNEIVSNIAAKKSSSKKKLSAEDIKTLPEFQSLVEEEVKDLKTELSEYENKISTLENQRKTDAVRTKLNAIAEKALADKKVRSERQRNRFVDDLYDLAKDWDIVDGKLIALDENGNAIKDKLHNQLDVSSKANEIASEDFDLADPDKKRLGSLGKPAADGFKVPTFSGSEDEIKQKKSDWYDSLDDKSKKAYQDHLVASAAQ